MRTSQGFCRFRESWAKSSFLRTWIWSMYQSQFSKCRMGWWWSASTRMELKFQLLQETLFKPLMCLSISQCPPTPETSPTQLKSPNNNLMTPSQAGHQAKRRRKKFLEQFLHPQSNLLLRREGPSIIMGSIKVRPQFCLKARILGLRIDLKQSAKWLSTANRA